MSARRPLLLSAIFSGYARGMENPYQPPQELAGQEAAGQELTTSGGGMAGQIPVVAILLMVQGGLEIAVGGLWTYVGGTFVVLSADQAQAAGPNAPLSPQAFGRLVGVVYILMAAATFAVATLKLFAGWQNYSFRGRTWGIAALASSVISIVTCYCFPTALMLMVYGLIVYLNAGAGWAFSMGDQGFTREQILQSLQRETSL